MLSSHFSLFITIATNVFLIVIITGAPTSRINGECGYLYLTQSSNPDKKIQINWHFTCLNPPDTILVSRNNSEIVFQHKVINATGWKITTSSLLDQKFPGNWNENDRSPVLGPHCLDYFVTGLRMNEIVWPRQCLSIQPSWMENFGDLKIGNMMIPGTHDSGAFDGAPPIQPVVDYTLTQDEDFWGQLVYGIRYFDVRVGRYEQPPNGLYITHGVVKLLPLLPQIQKVAKFVKKSPKEVIILNFHEFTYPDPFTLSDHKEILDMLWTTLGDVIAPSPYFNKTVTNYTDGPRIKDFWLAGKRVIISYNVDSLVKETPWLWPTVTRDWGNVINITDLQEYVKDRTSKKLPGNPMRVLMAELTPTVEYNIIHFDENLKYLAQIVNTNLTLWLTNDKLRNLNIIATDFFAGNYMVDLALQANQYRVKKSHP